MDIEQLKMKALNTEFGRICNEIESHTVQLWLVKEDNADKAIPLGSAVLLKANEKHYLLTAAHVMDDIDVTCLAFWDDQDLVQVSGKSVYLSNRAEVNRTGDIAVWLLSNDATSALLKHYSFLPIDRIRLNHWIKEEERYVIVGYPVSKTKKIFKTKTIPIKSFRFLTHGVRSKWKLNHNRLDLYVNFMLEYHRRKAQSFGVKKRQIEHLPAPHGLSGCGLWYLDDDKIVKLIGIMIGYNYSDAIMIASRIDLATEIMRKSFDPSLPMNTTIEVSWS